MSSSPISRSSSAATLLLYPLIAAAVLWPFAGRDLKLTGDLSSVIAGVVEARNALDAGQFPVRVAPNQWDGTGYPVFQYYGNFPYTLAGVLDLLIPGVDPYVAWKIVTFAALVLGGIYTRRCAKMFTGRRGEGGAVVAGVAFVAAPYMLVDIFARGLFGEVIAFCLLPVFMYYAWRAFRRPGIGPVVAAAVVWALVGLSHNITYLYGSIFVGLFFLTFAKPSKQYLRRAARLAFACALHGALLAWYFVPQVATLDVLAIAAHNDSMSMFESKARPTLGVVLAPTSTPPPAVPGSPIGIQVGWPILAGLTAAIGGAIVRGRLRRPSHAGGLRGRNLMLRAATLRFTALFTLATFMVWSPVDFWRWLPRMLSHVQFSYRLLMFSVLWGTLLIAVAIRWWAPRGLRGWQAITLIALIGLAASTYQPTRLPGNPDGVARTIERPQMGGLHDYLITPTDASRSLVTSDVIPQHISGGDGNDRQRFRVIAPMESRVRLPVLYYPGLLQVRLDKQPVAYENANGHVAVNVPAGEHRIDVRFIGIGWTNVVSAIAWTAAGVFAISIPAIAIIRRGSHRCRERCAAIRPVLGLKRTVITLAGFTLFVIGLRIESVYGKALAWIDPPVPVTVTTSRESPPQFASGHAFDDDRFTEWVAMGSTPITMTITPPKAMILRRVELYPRGLDFREAWQHVRVDLYRDNVRVDTRAYDLPDAWKASVVTVDPPATPADRVELQFSSPVIKLLDGRIVDPGVVNPGYTEIELDWDEAD